MASYVAPSRSLANSPSLDIVPTKRGKAAKSPAPAVGSDAFADYMVAYQRGKRTSKTKGALPMGAGLGGIAGYTALAIPAAIFAAPTGGGSLALLAVGLLGGAAVGGGAVPLMHIRHGNPKPDALRLHVFKHMRIVPTRAESERIMQALKEARVVARGRGREVIDLDPVHIDRALDSLALRRRGGVVLDATQRRGVRDVLIIMHAESARRRPLVARIDALKAATERRFRLLEAASAKGARLSREQAESTDPQMNGWMTEMGRLYAELALMPSQLGGEPERDAVCAPEAVTAGGAAGIPEACEPACDDAASESSESDCSDFELGDESVEAAPGGQPAAGGAEAASTAAEQISADVASPTRAGGMPTRSVSAPQKVTERDYYLS